MHSKLISFATVCPRRLLRRPLLLRLRRFLRQLYYAIRHRLLSALAPESSASTSSVQAPPPLVHIDSPPRGIVDARRAGLRSDLQGKIDSVKASASGLDGKVLNPSAGLTDLRIAQAETSSEMVAALDELRGRPAGDATAPPGASATFVPHPDGSSPAVDPVATTPSTFSEALAFFTTGTTMADVKVNAAIHSYLCSPAVFNITTSKISIPWNEHGENQFEA